MMNRRQFVFGSLCTTYLLRECVQAQAVPLAESWLGKASAGDVVNLARYGQLKSWLSLESATILRADSDVLRLSPTHGGKEPVDIGVEWPEFRTVDQVAVQFAEHLPEPAGIYLEYWDGLTALQGSWKAFEQGRTNGNHFDIQKQTVTYRFEQRRTCKVRLRFTHPAEVEITKFAVLGPSVWKSGDIRIEWGHGKSAPWNGRIESYNSEILTVQGIGGTRMDGTAGWSSPRGEKAGVHVSLLYASGMDVDRSILTIRSQNGDCSFLPGEAIESAPIDIVDHGVYIRNSQSGLDYAAYRQASEKKLRVIDAVAREPEQTLENAYGAIQPKRVSLSFVGAEANNQKFGIAPDGHIVVSNTDPLAGDPMTPSFAIYFDTAEQPFLFQPPPVPLAFHNNATPISWMEDKRQRLKDGWLPQIETQWSQNNLEFTRADFGTLLSHDQGDENLIGNEEAILVSRLRIRNASPTREVTTLFIRPWKPASPSRFPYGPIPSDIEEAWTTGLRNDLVVASSALTETIVCVLDTHQKGTLSLDPSHNAVCYQLRLEPGEEHNVHIVIPGWEPPSGDAAKLRGLRYEELERAASQHWQGRAEQAVLIRVPDSKLQNLIGASLQHLLLVLTKNGNKREYYPNVAMLYYGSIGSESSPIIRALDMLGMHSLAERCLDAFLSTQSEFMPEGDYGSKEGGFYRFWPIYTIDQGGVLWALADHYRLTRDDAWLRRVAPNIIAGCEFIVRERKRTMTGNAEAGRPLHYGLAPAGCVADPRDWQYSFMLNAWFYAGLKNCAEILYQVNSDAAKALDAEAADYRECIMRALKESVAVSPVTRLLDNTSVSSVPPYLGLRGFSTDVKDSVDPDRRHGYAYDCTIGPFHLFNCGVLEPDDPIVSAMLNYLEDRFCLATPLPSRVDIDRLAVDWFNLGGFEKLQPYYVHYQEAYLRRDQIPNFIRGFYNTLASIADPQTLTFQEELDFSGGQPHKTHEEAWFIHQARNMLVMESGTELHLARGTPRDWLKGGQQIAIRNAPTYFGKLSYQLDPAADLLSIHARIELPKDKLPTRTTLRFRHPTQKRIKSVTLNGRPWSKFDPDKEWIDLPNDGSEISLVAHYEDKHKVGV